MRFIILSIGLLLAFAPSRAQRQLDLKQCREMALEYSKQLAIAEKQKEKAVWTKKEYGANYLPKLSASGFYLYHQKKQEYKLSGGICRLTCLVLTGNCNPMLSSVLTENP